MDFQLNAEQKQIFARFIEEDGRDLGIGGILSE